MLDYRNKPSPQEFLAHHGIKGQKWGVRNGPPYPLDASDHSASENKAGLRNSLDKPVVKTEDSRKGAVDTSSMNNYNGKESSEKAGFHLSEKGRRALKIGLIAAAAALAAYGTYKLADSGELNRLKVKGKAILEGSPPEWRERPEFAASDMTPEQIFNTIIPRINPSYGKPGTSMNCRRCTFAYEISRRGYEVKATKSLMATGQNAIGVYNATHENPIKGGILGIFARALKEDTETIDYFVDNTLQNGVFGTPIDLKSSSPVKSVMKALGQHPDGARGEFSVHFKSGNKHSMAWEIIKGKPVIFDCQTREMFDSPKKIAALVHEVDAAGFLRLDNVQLNNDFLLRWVENL